MTTLLSMPNTEPESISADLVHVAVAVIERVGAAGSKEILIAKRPATAHQGGLWEFPGGKVESGEHVTDALIRELHEELGIVIPVEFKQSLFPLIQIQHDYGDKQVLLDVWRVTKFNGIEEGREGQPIRWVPSSHLHRYDFPEANKPIVTACCLPSFYVITPEYSSVSEAEASLNVLVEKGFQLILFRQPQLDSATYQAYVKSLLASNPKLSEKLMLSGGTELADLGVKGLHLPFRVAKGFEKRPVSREQYLAVSCHDEGEISHAKSIDADFITLSPVKQTSTHPGAAILGWEYFKILARRATMPVFALGGMTVDDFHLATFNGAHGLAGISLWQDGLPGTK